MEKRVRSGLQVLITNPKCVETGLDLNDFTTLIFYSMGYNLFTLRHVRYPSPVRSFNSFCWESVRVQLV